VCIHPQHANFWVVAKVAKEGAEADRVVAAQRDTDATVGKSLVHDVGELQQEYILKL
jgi:hypothetical protein